MVSAKTLLGLGASAVVIATFFGLGGAAGIGSRIGGGLRTFGDQIICGITGTCARTGTGAGSIFPNIPDPEGDNTIRPTTDKEKTASLTGSIFPDFQVNPTFAANIIGRLADPTMIKTVTGRSTGSRATQTLTFGAESLRLGLTTPEVRVNFLQQEIERSRANNPSQFAGVNY